MDASTSREIAVFGTADGLDLEAVSDACDRLGCGRSTTGLRPLWVGSPAMAGPAVTMEVVCDGFPVSTRHHLGVDAIEASSPGDIVVIDHRGRDDAAAWGGLLTESARRAGVRGVVIDGAARDVDEAAAAGFPLFGTGHVARTARGRVVQRSVNEPIHFRGVAVRPGDLVFVSSGGVVVVSADDVDGVVREARLIKDKEEAMRTTIVAGESMRSVLGQAYERMLEDQPNPLPKRSGSRGRE